MRLKFSGTAAAVLPVVGAIVKPDGFAAITGMRVTAGLIWHPITGSVEGVLLEATDTYRLVSVVVPAAVEREGSATIAPKSLPKLLKRDELLLDVDGDTVHATALDHGTPRVSTTSATIAGDWPRTDALWSSDAIGTVEPVAFGSRVLGDALARFGKIDDNATPWRLIYAADRKPSRWDWHHADVKASLLVMTVNVGSDILGHLDVKAGSK